MPTPVAIPGRFQGQRSRRSRARGVCAPRSGSACGTPTCSGADRTRPSSASFYLPVVRGDQAHRCSVPPDMTSDRSCRPSRPSGRLRLGETRKPHARDRALASATGGALRKRAGPVRDLPRRTRPALALTARGSRTPLAIDLVRVKVPLTVRAGLAPSTRNGESRPAEFASAGGSGGLRWPAVWHSAWPDLEGCTHVRRWRGWR
jgi:hypothetical protein